MTNRTLIILAILVFTIESCERLCWIQKRTHLYIVTKIDNERKNKREEEFQKKIVLNEFEKIDPLLYISLP